jgi:iron complex outermembrane receptor protein
MTSTPQLGTIKRVPGGRTSAIIEDGGNRNNSDYETDNFWAKVGFEPSEDTELYANLHYVTTEKGIPPDINSVQVFYADYFSRFWGWDEYEDYGIDLSGKHRFTDKWSIKGTLFYHNHKDDMAFYDDLSYANRIALSNYEDYIIGGMLMTEFGPVDWDKIRFAINYRGDSHEQRADESLPFAESFAYTGSAAFENEFYFLDNRLSIVAGASYDWYDTDKAEVDPEDDGNIIRYDSPDTMDEFNPMVGITYRANQAVRLFASVARKTRFPTLRQMFTKIPNLELDAETSINYVAGISLTHEDILEFTVSPFYYDISDYITRDVQDNPDDQYFNYEDIECTGLELNFMVRPIENLLIKADFTYTNAENKSSNRVTDNVINIPKYKAGLGVQYIIPRLKTKINCTMLHVGKAYDQVPTPTYPDDPEEKTEGYTFLNAKITQHIMDHFDAYVAVDNLFDKNREPEKYFPAPGRTIRENNMVGSLL